MYRKTKLKQVENILVKNILKKINKYKHRSTNVYQNADLDARAITTS